MAKPIRIRTLRLQLNGGKEMGKKRKIAKKAKRAAARKRKR